MFKKIQISLELLTHLDISTISLFFASLNLIFINFQSPILLIITCLSEILFVYLKFKSVKVLYKVFSLFFLVIPVFYYLLSISLNSANVTEFANTKAQIQGIVTSDLDCSNKYCKFSLQPINYSENILVDIKSSEQVLTIENGDLIIINSTFVFPKNYSDFDYQTYLKNKNIYLTTINTSLIEIQKTKNVFQLFRNYLFLVFNSVDSNFSQEEDSLLKGVVFGFRNDLAAELKQDFQDTGLTHIIAVSGFNVTLFISFCIVFAKFINRKNTYIVSLFFVTIYMSLVGFNNLPALRAYIMGGFLIISYFLGRKISKLNVILISLFLIELIDPKSILQVSFQLSMLAYLGIIYLQEILEIKLNFLPTLVRSNFSSSIIASFLSFPIVSQISGQLSLIAPIANIFILPLVPICMIVGLIYFLLKLVNLSFLLALPLKLILQLIIQITNVFASFDFSTIGLSARIQSILNIVWLIILIIIILQINYKNHENKTTTSKNSKNPI